MIGMVSAPWAAMPGLESSTAMQALCHAEPFGR